MHARPDPSVLSQRAPVEEVLALAERFQDTFAAATLDALPWAVILMNSHRQIVYRNKGFERMAVSDHCGHGPVRPGEALDCRHANLGPGGCGTSEYCQYCGMLQAILEAEMKSNVRECRVLKADAEGEDEALDLRVTACPIQFDDCKLTLLAAQDISYEKRLETMERVFYHDILNSASNLDGLAQLLEGEVSPRGREYVDLLRMSSLRINEEILAQRDLRAAERGDLVIGEAVITADQALARTRAAFEGHELTIDRKLAVQICDQPMTLRTDATLLGRILGNMIKNALEASQPGEIVTIGCRRAGDAAEFFVHNPEEMEQEAKLQVFKRSYSTKGPGRGLGTYGMKLIAQRYLGGVVGFTSSAEAGTTFFIRLPLKEAPQGAASCSAPEGSA
jgi:signal transduction histidine kinase